MHWSVKLPDNFEMRKHSWPCRFHINNNIGKYLLTRPKRKKERNCKFLVMGHYFKIGLIPKAISIQVTVFYADRKSKMRVESSLIQSSCCSFFRVIVPYEISKVNFRVETKILVSMSEEI
jgi:hypothetical protein